MSKSKHLTLDERIEIESMLKEGLNFTEIGEALGKHFSTISKEIRNHVIFKEGGSRYQPCLYRNKCNHRRDACTICSSKWHSECAKCNKQCFRSCKDFKEELCPRHERPPYVCNGCGKRNGCTLRRHLYDAKAAQKEYEDVLSESRQGIAIDPEELQRIDNIVSPLIRKGQSLHHICMNNADEIMLDEKTIYNYIDNGLLSVDNIDLPRKVRYRVRRKKKTVKIDKHCFCGRTYDDYLKFLADNPDISVVQTDSVEGRKGGKVLLTIFFTNCCLMLAFLRDHNTSKSVTDCYNHIYSVLGRDTFIKLFPLILADRGSEFTNPSAIEADNETGEVRTRVFYCDPQRSDQKGGCEVCHEMIRRVIPKGTSMDHLTQDDIDLMMSHINSYSRKKLNNQSPHQLFSTIFSEDILTKLNIKSIPANEINLTPELLIKR